MAKFCTKLLSDELPPLPQMEWEFNAKSYRREVFDVINHRNFDIDLANTLFLGSKKHSYTNCLFVLKAIRLMLATHEDEHGRTVWNSHRFFTPKEFRMTGREELLRMIRKFKKSFTVFQLERAWNVLKTAKVIVSHCGKIPSYHPDYRKRDGKGTVMFFRLNIGTIKRRINSPSLRLKVKGSSEVPANQAFEQDYAYFSAQELNQQTSASTLDQSSTADVCGSAARAVCDDCERTDGSSSQVSGERRETSALRAGVSEKKDPREVEIPMTALEGNILGQLRDMFWRLNKPKDEELTIEQFHTLRKNIRRGILTKEFLQEYEEAVDMFGPDWYGKPQYWRDTDFDFFLMRCDYIKREMQAAKKAMRLERMEGDFFPAQDMRSALYILGDYAFGMFNFDPFVQELTNERILELCTSRHSFDCKVTKYCDHINTTAEAVRGLTVWYLADEIEAFFPGVTKQTKELTRQHVRRWIGLNPIIGSALLQHIDGLAAFLGFSPVELSCFHRDAALSVTSNATMQLS